MFSIDKLFTIKSKISNINDDFYQSYWSSITLMLQNAEYDINCPNIKGLSIESLSAVRIACLIY